MNKIKTWALLILASLALAAGQAKADNVENANWAINYNLDATTYTYCKEIGGNNSPFGGTIAGPGNIQTSGSSTSVTETVVGSLPFALLSVKDVIFVTRPTGVTDVRSIVTRTDSSNIVLDTAVDWTGGFAFRWLKTVCGTTVNDGWIDVGNYVDKALTVEFNQGDLSGGLDVSFECKTAGPTAQPVTVYPSKGDTCGQGTQTVAQECNLPTAGVGKANRLTYVSTDPWNACRIGIKAHTSDPSDAGTNMEQINLSFQGKVRN